MDFKKVFVISCLLITIFLINNVCAIDINESNVSNSDEIIIFNESQTTIQSIDEGSFDDLAQEINNADVLVLNKNYKHSGNNKEGILINKSITIDGRDFTIDGNNNSRIFDIRADNVILKNINFINANASNSGGSIFAKANNLQIINCNFTNSKSTTTGAAITLIGDSISVSNSNFINGNVVRGNFLNLHPEYIQEVDIGEGIIVSGNTNVQYAFGGAVYVEGTLTVKGSSFKNNFAKDNGGAIFAWSGSNLTVIESTFDNNCIEYYNLGGVTYYEKDIYSKINTTIIDSKINHIYNIEVKANLTLIQSPNIASNISGSFGELLRKINESDNILILDKDYKYVDGDNRGIEIVKPITIDGCGHTLDASGLSRIFNIQSDNVTLRNINFVNGIAFDGYLIKSDIGGGSIYWNGNNAKIINCSFINNSAIDTAYYTRFNPTSEYDIYFSSQSRYDSIVGGIYNWAGAIYLNGNNTLISQCKFINNSAPYTRGYSGAIDLNGNDALIEFCEFYNNVAFYYSSISYAGNKLIINASLFYHNLNNIYDKEVSTNNVLFFNSAESTYAKSVADNLTISYFKDLSDSKIVGVYNGESYAEVMYNLFNIIINNYNPFDDLARQIDDTEDILILNKDYINLGNNISGILINKPITIDGRGHTIDANNNSRIFWIKSDNVCLKNIKFINANSKVYAGGAIAWIGDNATIVNCTFDNCLAPASGGAIAWIGDNISFINSSFTNSHAIEADWSRIAILYNFDSKMVYVAVLDSRGGALYIAGSNSSIINCKFKNNSALSGNDYIAYNEVKIINSILVNQDIDEFNKEYNDTKFIQDSNSTDEIEKIIIEPKIINNKNLTLYFKSTNKFTVTVFGSDGKLAINKLVKFTIGKQIITVKTNKNGVASLKINQNPGKYSIITEYSGVKVKNSIIVKSRLITNDLTKKAKKSLNFKVKVLNTRGKAFSKQTIKITFKGKTYKLKTNLKGIAIFKLNKKLGVGRYTIKTTYCGLSNNNKIIVKK